MSNKIAFEGFSQTAKLLVVKPKSQSGCGSGRFWLKRFLVKCLTKIQLPLQTPDLFSAQNAYRNY